MDCEKFDRVLMDLLYDELDELTRASAVRHTDHCQRCRGELTTLKVTREAGAVALLAAPDGFEQRVLAAELATRQGLPWTQRMERWWTIATGYAMRPQLAMAALLMLMIGSGLLLLRPKPGPHGDVQVSGRGTPRNQADEVVVPLEPERTAMGEAEVAAVPKAAEPEPEPEVEPAKVSRKAAPTVRSIVAAPAISQQVAPVETADEAIRKAEDQAFEAALTEHDNGDLDRARTLFDEIVSSGGRMAPDAEFLAATATETLHGCPTALPRYDSVSARQVRGDLANKAKLRSASCRLKTGEIKRALLDLQSLISVPDYRARAQQLLNKWNHSAEAQRSGLTSPRAMPPGPPPQATTVGQSRE